MLTRRERISAALLARLATLPDITVERNRRSMVDPSEAPHINMLDGDHTVSYDDPSCATYAMTVDLDGIVAASTDSELGPAVNDAYGRVVAAIAAEPSLGGLCIEIRETGMIVGLAPAGDASPSFAIYAVTIEILFDTPDGNPFG